MIMTAASSLPSLIGTDEAFSRMSADQAREAAAYALGVETVQWVKGGLGFRMFSAPLPGGTERSPVDPQPHGVNVWGINWLPAPADGFFVVMRMYQPEERMYRGEYIVPPVRKAG